MDRFEYNDGFVYDKADGKEVEFNEVVRLLNQLQERNIAYRNDMERIKESLISLDILIGELSWLVDEREKNDIELIREKSKELSHGITRIMYPKTESENDWWY